MKKVKVFLAGDSTMSNYDATVAPRAGWGQMLTSLVGEGVEVRNEAASGRSSKSFIEEGRLAKIEQEIGQGDYLLIQFGHNDEKEDEARHTEPFDDYQGYLDQFITVARSKQAVPILITPVQRRTFNAQGELQDTHGLYPEAMMKLAVDRQVPLIDLGRMSKELLEQLGLEPSKKLFLWFAQGEHPNYPEGVQDDTHFSQFGAHEIAKWMVYKLQELGIQI
ncbi:lysophospholipase L1-like esterase [Paenibacillus sp. DS2015]|uniref:rhamnogalacturonan acetylesterase n=1 Tax=Paenibacillus sp. DS2015 TaxID=3373917 RepID=UPI003D1BB39D